MERIKLTKESFTCLTSLNTCVVKHGVLVTTCDIKVASKQRYATRAIIGGMVSNSPLMSALAEAVEVIHGVMPPVLFQGFSWASIDHVAS